MSYNPPDDGDRKDDYDDGFSDGLATAVERAVAQVPNWYTNGILANKAQIAFVQERIREAVDA